MSFTSSYVMAGIGTFFILFWLFLYIKYRNAYDQVIDAIDKKKFMFGEIYFIGFGFITLFHINIKTERGSKKIKEISEIYGRKYAEFYHYVITGGSISYFLTLLPMGFCLGAIANNVMLGVLGVVASALLLEYMSGEIKKNVNERREDILEDLPQMLSKFTLLINAGLIVRDAWFKVAYANDKPIYKEMQEACVEMNNGVPVREAVFHFADRCSVAEVRKFANSVNQNMEKGGSELTRVLKELTTVSWDEKGAVPIVEATFIFPIVFFCMFFLIYIGMYILQSVLIYTQTQKVASIVSKSMAVTGYEKVGKHTADNVNFDFKDNKYFTQDSVNTIYDEKAKLYRYFYPDPIAGNSDIESINSSLTSLIDNLSIISGGGVTCDINAKNYFINQTVSVTIKREGAIPEVFSYIGMDGVSSDITVTATAASCDGAEFVRNTDMVYDFVTFLSDRLHISDKISYLKEKVQGVFQEDAKEAANAAG